MKIKKAKLEDEGLTVIYTERPEGRKERKTTQEDKTIVHPDLIAAFSNLRIHLAILCGYVKIKDVKNIETPKEPVIEPFHVKGISVKTGDDPGVVISGHVILENGKAVILNTPFTRFKESEESQYKFTDDLKNKIARAEIEVNEYVDGTKKGDDPQQSLFSDQAPAISNGGNDSDELTPVLEGDDEIWEEGKRPKT